MLGALVAVRCPSELDPLMLEAGGLWEPSSRRWLIEPRRIGPLVRNLRRVTDPLFRQAGISLDDEDDHLRAAWKGRCRPSGALRQASSMCCSDWWCMPQRSRPAAGYSSEGTWGRLVTFVIGSCLARFGAGAIAAGSPRSIPAETVRAFAAPARTASEQLNQQRLRCELDDRTAR